MQPILESVATSSSAIAVQQRIKELEGAQSTSISRTAKRKASDFVDLTQEHTTKGHSTGKITSWIKSLPLGKDQVKHLQESINEFNKAGGLPNKDLKDGQRILASMGIPVTVISQLNKSGLGHILVAGFVMAKKAS